MSLADIEKVSIQGKEFINPDEQLKIDLRSCFVWESVVSQEIDHAVGIIEIDGEKKRYFGATQSQELIKMIRNQPYTSIEKVPVIITEDGFIMSKTTPVKNTKFVFGTVMTLKKDRWSNFKEFVFDDFKDTTYADTFNFFKGIYSQNMVYEDSRDYEFSALWDMLTYHQDLLDKALIIKREGVSGSAKSKGMKISSNLSFNGRKWLKPTPANFFRYRNCNKSTIYIEEAEKLFDTQNKNSSDSELVEYLNGSYERGNYVPRQDDKDINKTNEFDPFGFTQIGSIKPLKGALEKRTITITMIKARMDDLRGNSEIPTEMDPLYVEARNCAYISSLLHYKEFLKALENTYNDYELSNREWLLAKPIIALASCISPELPNRMGQYLYEKFNSRDISSFDETNWKFILANVLIKITCKTREEVFVNNLTLKTNFYENPNIGEYTKISTQGITTLMKELGFSPCRNTKGTDRGFYLSFLKVCDILLRNQTLTKEDIVKTLSDLSDCQFKDDEICSDNLLTNTLTKVKSLIFSDNLTDKTKI